MTLRARKSQMWQLNSSSGFCKHFYDIRFGNILLSVPQLSTVVYDKSPVCKCLLGASFLSSFALHFPLQQYHRYFVYRPDLIVKHQQLWRLFTARLAFLDLKDMMVGSILIYYFRIFERRYGSRKFVNNLIGSYILSTMIEIALTFTLNYLDVQLNPFPSGPFYLIYPFYVPYFCDIPRVELGNILGIPMTGKSFQYFIGLQLATGSLESVLVAMCGIMAGIMWRQNFFKIQHLIAVPNFLARPCYRLLGQFVESSEPKNPSLPMGATLELQRQEQLDQLEQQVIWQSLQQQGVGQIPQNLMNGPGFFGAANLNPPEGLRQRQNIEREQQEVSEENVQQLVDMGFEESQVRAALERSYNDMNSATNMLLQEG